MPLTSQIEELVPFRPLIEPDGSNGLRHSSQAMVDKILAVRLEKFGERFGELAPADLRRIEGMMLIVLGLVP